MQSIYRIALLSAGLTAALPALAASQADVQTATTVTTNKESSTPPASPWTNDAELGAVQTAGNTQTLSLNAKIKSVYEQDQWRATLSGSAVNAKSNKATTAEKYDTSLQGDWKLNPIEYVFARTSFESDRFAGYKRRFNETGGYGRQLIDTEQLNWKGELGGGLRQTTPTNQQPSEFSVVARLATDVSWQFSKTSKLSETFSTEGGAKGWTTKSLTALQSALSEHLSSKISLGLTHNTKVPAGVKRLDSETMVTLVISF